MSQVYTWLNYDKMERLDWRWSSGGKLWDCCWTHCEENNALLTLLAGRWRGDYIIRYGCEGLDVPEGSRPFLAEIEEASVEERYIDSVDITDLFEEARNCPCGACGTDHGLTEKISEEPFRLKLGWYRYIMNVVRKQFIDRERTAVRGIGRDGVHRDDLFTVLLTPWGRREMVGGERAESWFGEALAVSNDRPDDGYADLSDVRCYGSAPLDLSDDEILAYACEGAPEYEASPEEWDECVSKRLNRLIDERARGRVWQSLV